MAAKQVMHLVSRWYLHYDDESFKNIHTIDQFRIRWGNEHGGYYTKDQLAQTFDPPKILPQWKSPGVLWIPCVPHNDDKFLNLYVKTGNELLLAFKGKTLTLDFRGNGGGKPQIMIAALLPLFNVLKKRTVLTYLSDHDGNIHPDVIFQKGRIECISNNNAFAVGTRMSLHIDRLTVLMNSTTASAAEQCIIALYAIPVHLIIRGKRSAGLTTCNKFFRLKNGNGIEIPIGYVCDINKKIYRNGIHGK